MSLQDQSDAQDDARTPFRGRDLTRGAAYQFEYDLEERRVQGSQVSSGGDGGALLIIGATLVAMPLFLLFVGGVVGSWRDLAWLVVAAIIASFPGGLIVLLLTRLFRRDVAIGYRSARKSSLYGLLLYIALTIVMTWVVSLARISELGQVSDLWNMALVSVRSFSVAQDVSLFAARPVDAWPDILGTLLIVRGPGLLAFAFVLVKRIGRPYVRFLGWLAAIVVCFAAVEVGLSFGLRICRELGARAEAMPIAGDERLAFLVIYSALMLLPCALIGALAGGLVVRAVGRERADIGGDRFLSNYTIALRALLAFGALTVTAVAAFRSADPLVWWLVGLVFGRPHEPAYSSAALAGAVMPLLVLLLPGLLWAAGIIAVARPEVYPGLRGYAKACAVATAAFVPVYAVVGYAALQFLSPLVVWLRTAAAHSGSVR